MDNKNRTCYACDTRYHYCSSCPSEVKPIWSTMFCSEECKEIFDIAKNYNLKKINAVTAFNQFSNILTKDISTYNESIQDTYKRITDEIDKEQSHVKENVIIEDKSNSVITQPEKFTTHSVAQTSSVHIENNYSKHNGAKKIS